MTDPKALLVTLNAADLRELIRDEVSAALANKAPVPVAPTPYLTSDQAAAFLSMPVGVLRKKVRTGEIPSFKVGAVLRFRVAELDAWLDGLKTQKAG